MDLDLDLDLKLELDLELDLDLDGRMIRIMNTRVYGLEESVIASGYPMCTEAPHETAFDEEALRIKHAAASTAAAAAVAAGAGSGDATREIKRAGKLGSAPSGSGHDCFLKGIIVQADFQLPQYMWQQAKRYHWFDFVSSQSTMHRITSMDIMGNCNEYVDKRVIAILEEHIATYNKAADASDTIADASASAESASASADAASADTADAANAVKDRKNELFHYVAANIPSGFLLTARITTNYLQLKTMYNQRKYHKMNDWKEFAQWCENLPHFLSFTQNKRP